MHHDNWVIYGCFWRVLERSFRAELTFVMRLRLVECDLGLIAFSDSGAVEWQFRRWWTHFLAPIWRENLRALLGAHLVKRQGFGALVFV